MGQVGIIRNELLFLLILSMCKLRRITHKLFHKALRALFSLWVIRLSLHIDKINKNKIHSYIDDVMVAGILSKSN